MHTAVKATILNRMVLIGEPESTDGVIWVQHAIINNNPIKVIYRNVLEAEYVVAITDKDGADIV